MGAISPSQFTTAYCVIFGVYGLQMLLTPDKMTTQFFKTPATPMLRFWVRGFSVTVFAIRFTLYKLMSFDATLATQIAVASTAYRRLLPVQRQVRVLRQAPRDLPQALRAGDFHGGLLAVGAYVLAKFAETRRSRQTRESCPARGVARPARKSER